MSEEVLNEILEQLKMTNKLLADQKNENAGFKKARNELRDINIGDIFFRFAIRNKILDDPNALLKGAKSYLYTAKYEGNKEKAQKIIDKVLHISRRYSESQQRFISEQLVKYMLDWGSENEQ